MNDLQRRQWQGKPLLAVFLEAPKYFGTSLTSMNSGPKMYSFKSESPTDMQTNIHQDFLSITSSNEACKTILIEPLLTE